MYVLKSSGKPWSEDLVNPIQAPKKTPIRTKSLARHMRAKKSTKSKYSASHFVDVDELVEPGTVLVKIRLLLGKASIEYDKL